MISRIQYSAAFRLILFGISLQPVTMAAPEACRVPACICQNINGTSDSMEAYHVTCYVPTLSMSDATVSQLSSDITSLTLICSDRLHSSIVTKGLFALTPWLEDLRIIQCNIYASPGVFQDLTHLYSLTIQNSVFSHLPEHFLASTLAQLTITQCVFAQLPQICELLQLEKLNLSQQSVSSLDDSVRKCSPSTVFYKLRVLDLSNASLPSMPESLLRRVPNLRELYLGYNHISEWKAQNLTFQHLQVLDLLGQPIPGMTENLSLFLSFPQIRILKLEGYENDSFPIENLFHSSQITDLYLSKMNLNDTIWAFLARMPDLRRLHLAWNNLSTIGLDKTTRLQELNLTGNQIWEIEQVMFQHQSDLEVLDLSSNHLSVLYSDVFFNLTSLQTLVLSDNKLNFFYQYAFRNLLNTNYLSLNHNLLTALPQTLFSDLKNLKELDIQSNRLLYLPDVKNLSELAVLDAAYNQITNLNSFSLDGVTKLEFLFLNDNKIEALKYPTIFQKNPWLRFLDLRNNGLTRLGQFGHHPTLTFIRLENNSLQDLTFTFIDLAALETVLLDYNFISRLTVNIFPPSLQSLTLTHNILSHIDSNIFFNMPKLRVVDLGYNPFLIKIINNQMRVSSALLRKPSIFLANNVFDCDCSLGFLKAWDKYRHTIQALSSELPDFADLHLVRCFTFLPLFNKRSIPFKDVPLWHFVCPLDSQAQCPPKGLTQAGLADDLCPEPVSCPSECSCFQGGSEYVKWYVHVVCTSKNLTSIPAIHSPYITHIYLDGNELGVISCSPFFQGSNLILLLLNNSQLQRIEPDSFKNFNSLEVLDLSHNKLTSLQNDTFGNMTSLRELYLQHNQINDVSLETFSKLTALRILRLDFNSLISLSSFSIFPPEAVITLANNPWTCKCKFVWRFLLFIRLNVNNISDSKQVRCFWNNNRSLERFMETKDNILHNDSMLDDNSYQISANTSDQVNVTLYPSILLLHYDYERLCSASYNLSLTPGLHQSAVGSTFVPAIIGVVVVVVVLIAVGSLVVWRKREVQALMYDKFGLRLWDEAHKLDLKDEASEGVPNIREYDAFVSYSHDDEDFVVNDLAPRLEQDQGPRRYKLCLHYRDFPVGASIADTISEKIQASKRTMLLLSENFLSSEWCRFEFRTAHHHVLKEGGHRLIIILLGPIVEEHLDPDLRVTLKTQVYLRKDDPWFWQKLYFALPAVRVTGGQDMIRQTDRQTEIETDLSQSHQQSPAVPASVDAARTPHIQDNGDHALVILDRIQGSDESPL